MDADQMAGLTLQSFALPAELRSGRCPRSYSTLEHMLAIETRFRSWDLGVMSPARFRCAISIDDANPWSRRVSIPLPPAHLSAQVHVRTDAKRALYHVSYDPTRGHFTVPNRCGPYQDRTDDLGVISTTL